MDTNADISCTTVLDQTPTLPAADEAGRELAGYTLEERLGVGGYGEVWRAIGPGGFPKALKIMFGRLDGPQADAELKALEHVRELRHPFLLSVERVERVEGRLIVVTELADRCLEDRFQEAQQSGSAGVPRDELLGYLRDAADALDFMFEQHGLQHLDIKPDNLLLQGDHVKVGDFGLIKDVGATRASAVGGFTPLYAPPEIFEGRPSRGSDQYSLAIVYQMMLTGVPPFAGRTAAQLTAQHLRSKPDLTALQPVDRPVIARALSKNPQSRYPSCRQLVDELARRRVASVRTAQPRKAAATGTSRTQVVDPATLAVPGEVAVQEPRPIAPVPLPKGEGTRPTLVIGLGGLGGQVVCRLADRLTARFGDESISAVPLLFLDSDDRSLRSARQRPLTPLTDTQTLAMPLATSRDYRGRDNLSWLSRRWLFNIPRSGRVEGMRALGRLALVDHQDQIRHRVRDLVSDLTNAERLADSSAQTGLGFGGCPDVYVVASTTGGTGSGAAIDLGYLVREVLAEAGVEAGTISGILLHGTSAVRALSDIQQANSMSCLRELQHFNVPGMGGARGPRGSAEFDEQAPFDHTYLIHLGDSLDESDFADQAGNVAEYLFGGIVDGAGATFAAWRQLDSGETDGSEPRLRTFGYGRVDADQHAAVRGRAAQLCLSTLQSWLAGTDGERRRVAAETSALMKELNLTDSALAGRAMAVLRGSTGDQIEACSRSTWDRVVAEGGSETMAQDSLFERLDAWFAPAASAAALDPIVGPVRQATHEAAADAMERLRQHLAATLDSPARLTGAAEAVHQIIGQLEASDGACRRLLTEIETATSDLRGPHTDGSGAADARATCRQYCALHAYRAIYECFVNHVAELRQQVQDLGQQLIAVERGVQSWTSRFDETEAEPLPADLVERFDIVLCSHERFSASHCGDSEWDAAAATDELLTEALRFLATLDPSGGSADAEESDGFPQSAHPLLANAGGGRRVLAQIPPAASIERWMKKLQDTFGDCVSVEPASENIASVYCEVSGIRFDTVLNLWASCHPGLSDIASRVHTRTDITWYGS